MAVDPRPYRRRKLPYAGMYLAELLEENDKPVVDPLDFFRITRRMYREGPARDYFCALTIQATMPVCNIT